MLQIGDGAFPHSSLAESHTHVLQDPSLMPCRLATEHPTPCTAYKGRARRCRLAMEHSQCIRLQSLTRVLLSCNPSLMPIPHTCRAADWRRSIRWLSSVRDLSVGRPSSPPSRSAVSLHIYPYRYLYLYVYIHTYTYIYIYIHVYIHTYTSIYLSLCMYITREIDR